MILGIWEALELIPRMTLESLFPYVPVLLDYESIDSFFRERNTAAGSTTLNWGFSITIIFLDAITGITMPEYPS